MQVLNNYVASLTQEQHICAARVIFWLLEGSSLSRVDAELPAHGSLGPLFHAFGLVSDEELTSGAGSYLSGKQDVYLCSRKLQNRDICGQTIQFALVLSGVVVLQFLLSVSFKR